MGGTALETLDNDRLAVFRRRKVGFIFQQYNLIPDLNVYDNILFPLELDGARIDRKFIDYLLETLHISSKRVTTTSIICSSASGSCSQQDCGLERRLHYSGMTLIMKVA